MRGFFGIGIDNPKNEVNLGTLWRSAHCLNAAFIFTIGNRYRKQASDTSKAYRSIPFIEYHSWQDLLLYKPKDCRLIGVEFPAEGARSLINFCHPERAIYVLGAEDKGLSRDGLALCDHIVYIQAKLCLNVSVAGSIVMYDRIQKGA